MKVRQNGFLRGVFALLLVGTTFAAALCGCEALWMTEFAYGDNWQDNARYDYLRDQTEQEATMTFLQELELGYGESDYVHQRELESQIATRNRALDETNTNYRYQILDASGEVVLKSNLSEGEVLGNLVSTVSYSTFTSEYHAPKHQVGGGLLETLLGEVYQSVTEYWENRPSTIPPVSQGGEDYQYILVGGVVRDIQNSGVKDGFYQLYVDYLKLGNFNGLLIAISVLGAAMALCLLYLLWTVGYRKGAEGAVFSWEEGIPLELHILLFGGGSLLSLAGAGLAFHQYRLASFYSGGASMGAQPVLLVAVAMLLTVAVLLAVMVLCTLVVRLRCRMVIRSTLCYYIIHGIWCNVKLLVNNIPVIWRVTVLFLVYISLNFAGRYGLPELYPIPVFVVDSLMLGILLWWSISFRTVRTGTEAIAAGNLSHRIDSRKLPHDLKRHAESLNNISLGMESAVDSRIKSERFKAELITNVSHDLKTPLTSIINYVNLLKTTEQTDPHAAEYIEVLERKSQRLKKLTEDLVEASKASTGALKVEREKIGMEQLVEQALGEYKEKLDSKGLLLVVDTPEGESPVLADGRHLWRVIDNLLGNCVKYAMEGTRVYVELTRGHGQVVLSIKNITREPLTTSPDQLVERFVRGDEARTSEGSGLGLSIAKSLTELQGGTFDLVVDGDLFKVILTMPQAG